MLSNSLSGMVWGKDNYSELIKGWDPKIEYKARMYSLTTSVQQGTRDPRQTEHQVNQKE